MKRWLACLLLVIASTLMIGTAARADTEPSTNSAQHSDLDDEVPPDVRAKLSPEQLQSVMLERARHDAAPPAVAVVVPVALFVMVLGIVVASLVANHRRERLRHETVRHAIAHGAPIPPELLASHRSPVADLRRGIILLATGAGLLTLLFATEGAKGGAWSVAAIPILLGVAYLVVHKLERVHQPSRLSA